MGLTAIKYVAELRESDPERAGRIIALSSQFAALTGGVMALGLFFSASWLATHTIDAPQLAGALRIAALFLFISALTGAQTGALSGLEAFQSDSSREFVFRFGVASCSGNDGLPGGALRRGVGADCQCGDQLGLEQQGLEKGVAPIRCPNHRPRLPERMAHLVAVQSARCTRWCNGRARELGLCRNARQSTQRLCRDGRFQCGRPIGIRC